MKTNYLLWIGAAIVLYIVWAKMKATAATTAQQQLAASTGNSGIFGSGVSVGDISGVISTLDGGSDSGDDYDDF